MRDNRSKKRLHKFLYETKVDLYLSWLAWRTRTSSNPEAGAGSGESHRPKVFFSSRPSQKSLGFTHSLDNKQLNSLRGSGERCEIFGSQSSLTTKANLGHPPEGGPRTWLGSSWKGIHGSQLFWRVPKKMVQFEEKKPLGLCSVLKWSSQTSGAPPTALARPHTSLPKFEVISGR